MSSFYNNILNSTIFKKNKNENEYFLIFIFNTLIYTKNTNKFDLFINTLNNSFFTEKQKEDFINVFCKIQKTYFALSKLAYLYKYNKAKIVVDNDMYLNPIDINNKNTICLLQDKNKYYFRINDLINIINRSLSNSPYFFCEVLIPKNPYNNTPFDKSTLYNIYFYIRTRTLIIPELLHKFFLCNFELDNFEKNYEYLIREYAIINYINDMDTDALHNLVLTMIDYFNTNNQYYIDIDDDFPKKYLINIMKPYLFLYCTYNFSLIGIKKIQSIELFFKKMKKFYKFNPLFGRKIIKIQSYITKNKIKKFKPVYSYNDKHINFY